MEAAVTAGAGFLLAVLWFDLMFDVQLLRQPRPDGAETAVASIASYYRRVTTDAFPMNRFVAAVMVATVAAVVAQVVAGDEPAWRSWSSLALVLTPVGVAAGRTVRLAQRLGSRVDPPAEQHAMGRRILRDHLFCFTSVAALLVLQLAG